MKSAYELALERLEQARGPMKRLNEEQKARISDVEKVYDAKIAEVKLSYNSKLNTVSTAAEYETLKAELARKIETMEEKRDKEKDAIWNAC